MKKALSLVLFFSLFISSIFSNSVLSYFPYFSSEEQERLLSGEMLKGTSVSDDIRAFIAKDSIITDTCERVLSYEKGFVVALDMLIPYPKEMEGMSQEEKLLFLYNNSLKVSTMKGIQYISHRAGDKLKVLFDDAYMLGSDDIDDRIDDPEVEGVPEYAEHYVYFIWEKRISHRVQNKGKRTGFGDEKLF